MNSLLSTLDAGVNLRIQSDPRIRFTGFKVSPNFVKVSDMFVFQGLATFASGRQELVFYYVCIALDEGTNSFSDIEGRVEKAIATCHRYMQLASEQGMLINWRTGRKVRPVVTVDWRAESDIPAKWFGVAS